MKTITIAGNVGRNAETRTTQGGDTVTGWTVAVEDRAGREKSTLWFDVSMWGKRGETLAQYIQKGSKVVVTGDLSKREHEGKTYLTVRADSVTLMGGGQDRQPTDRPHPHDPQRANVGGGPLPDDFDSIPFNAEWRA